MRPSSGRLHAFLLAGISLLLTGTFAHADLLTLQPGPAAGKDTQIDNGSPNSNWGNLPWIVINWSGNARSIGLLEFDLSGLPNGAIVQSATLTLFQEFNNNLNAQYDIFRATSAWNEATATFNTAPSYDPTAVSSLVIPDSNQGVFRNWDVTTLVQGWANNTYANFGMWLEEVPVQGNSTAYFSSSDSGNEAWRPMLQIEYTAVPTPAGVVMAGMGLSGIFLLRKRFRQRQIVC